MSKEVLLSATFDSHAGITWLDSLQKKQLPYATSRAINDTSALAVEAVKAAAKDKFINRRDWYNKNLTYEASNKRDWPNIKSKVGFLERKGSNNDWIIDQEFGLSKTPTAGKRSIARPADIRKSPTDILTPKLWPSRMKDIDWSNVSTKSNGTVKKAQLRRRKKGANKRFTIRTKKGKLAIVIRQGAARTPLRFLYIMEKEVKLKTKVSIREIVSQVTNNELPQQFIKWFNKAIQTAR